MTAHRERKFMPAIGAAIGVAMTIATVQAAGSRHLSGSVAIEQVQMAFIGSANVGGGTLYYRGKAYPFTVGGLGIGGFGISKMEAVGEVYDLPSLKQFSGVYGQARYGAVVGNASNGELWLQNSAGVAIHLKSKRRGLALSLGVDGVQIQLK